MWVAPRRGYDVVSALVRFADGTGLPAFFVSARHAVVTRETDFRGSCLRLYIRPGWKKVAAGHLF